MFEFLKKHLAGTANIISLIAVLIVVYSFLRIVMVDTKLAGFIEDQKKAETVMNQRLDEIEQSTQAARNEITFLNNYFNEKSADFEENLGKISDSVGTLEKLNETDKELLQKYSKVYFLNEHYVPQDLTRIGREYLTDPEKRLQIHTSVQPYLEDMLAAALDDEIEIKVLSAYRSFGEQTSLKANYKVTYGSGANQFSADQGYSEHQLGTTVDLTSPENNLTLNNFQGTRAYEWLKDHAWEYGFTLSYPENNAYYEYEPWHWRFVGKSLARKLYRDGVYFYDMEQREIDKFLLNIFD